MIVKTVLLDLICRRLLQFDAKLEFALADNLDLCRNLERRIDRSLQVADDMLAGSGRNRQQTER